MIEGLFDRFFIDWFWVGKTKAWLIPGTEDLMPYIPKILDAYIFMNRKCRKELWNLGWLSCYCGSFSRNIVIILTGMQNDKIEMCMTIQSMKEHKRGNL